MKSISHIIEFDGDGSVNVNTGQSLLDAALLEGIRHVHVCGGTAKCSTCRVDFVGRSSAIHTCL